MTTFFLLCVAHAVADFGLQSDWMAQNKRTSLIVRAMHSLIHGGAVYVVMPQAAVVETLLHFGIDSITKNGKRPPLWLDQFAHVACKVAYIAIWGAKP